MSPRSLAPLGLGALGALIVLLLSGALAPRPPALTPDDVAAIAAAAMASATAPPPDSALAYAAIQPSLILVQVTAPGADGQPSSRIGSGVVVTDRGDILTSLHVVADADRIEVTFADGTVSRALVMAAQPENDIAVLQAVVPPAQIVPAVLGSPGAMRVGDAAYVVGHPLGLYGTLSAGVISGFERTFQAAPDRPELSGLIQFDAAVNPGSSGGPLLNRAGQVVGIVTGLANPTDQNVFIGVGFAVPITSAGQAAGLPPY